MSCQLDIWSQLIFICFISKVQFQIDFWFHIEFASYHQFNIHLNHVNIYHGNWRIKKITKRKQIKYNPVLIYQCFTIKICKISNESYLINRDKRMCVCFVPWGLSCCMIVGGWPRCAQICFDISRHPFTWGNGCLDWSWMICFG